MEKGTALCGVITVDSHQTHKDVIRNYCRMCSTHWHWAALVRTLEVSWLSSVSPDEWWNTRLYLLVNRPRPPPTKSLTSSCSCSVSLLVASHTSSAVETCPLHKSDTRWHSQRAYKFKFHALSLLFTLRTISFGVPSLFHLVTISVEVVHFH
jgi:hypothetical protein